MPRPGRIKVFSVAAKSSGRCATSSTTVNCKSGHPDQCSPRLCKGSPISKLIDNAVRTTNTTANWPRRPKPPRKHSTRGVDLPNPAAIFLNMVDTAGPAAAPVSSPGDAANSCWRLGQSATARSTVRLAQTYCRRRPHLGEAAELLFGAPLRQHHGLSVAAWRNGTSSRRIRWPLAVSVSQHAGQVARSENCNFVFSRRADRVDRLSASSGFSRIAGACVC